MKGEDWKETFVEYMNKINDGKWMKQHYYDPRNSDRVADKISLDTESRTTIEYLKALLDMVNVLRSEANLEIVK